MPLETAAGLYAASVPVVNSRGAVLAALTLCVPTSRMSDERRELLLADLRTAGSRLSEGVGWLAAFNMRQPVAEVASGGQVLG